MRILPIGATDLSVIQTCFGPDLEGSLSPASSSIMAELANPTQDPCLSCEQMDRDTTDSRRKLVTRDLREIKLESLGSPSWPCNLGICDCIECIPPQTSQTSRNTDGFFPRIECHGLSGNQAGSRAAEVPRNPRSCRPDWGHRRFVQASLETNLFRRHNLLFLPLFSCLYFVLLLNLESQNTSRRQDLRPFWVFRSTLSRSIPREKRVTQH